MSAAFWHSSGNAHTTNIPDRRWQRWWFVMLILILLCTGLILLSLVVGVGSVTLTPGQIWQALWTPEDASRITNVAMSVRLSRALMGLGVGAALGTAGALLQALYRNPLADPGITGVTQGAVTAAVCWITFGPAVAPGSISWVLPGVAAVGACLAAAITWGVTRLAGQVEPVRLILMGILVGGVLGAITSICLLWAGDDATVLIAWLSGSLTSVTWDKIRLFGGAIAIVLPLVLVAIPQANVLQLGDDVATGLGQNVNKARAFVLVAACVLTAAAVCTVGGIGFVGLVAPHLLRWLVGSDMRRLAPTAALAGGTLVTLADFVARNLHPISIGNRFGLSIAVVSLPVGVYLALLGGPFFLFILRRTR